MWGWESFSSKLKAGNRLISALFSNKTYVGSCPILSARVRLPYQLIVISEQLTGRVYLMEYLFRRKLG